MIVTEPPPPYTSEKNLTIEMDRQRAYNIYEPTTTELKPIITSEKKPYIITDNQCYNRESRPVSVVSMDCIKQPLNYNDSNSYIPYYSPDTCVEESYSTRIRQTVNDYYSNNNNNDRNTRLGLPNKDNHRRIVREIVV